MAKHGVFAYKCGVELPERIEENVRRYKLLDDGSAILLGVSGGLDSMVLLHLVHKLALQHNWSPTVAHFNHCLRGEESDADEKFVQDAASELNLAFRPSKGDVRACAKEKGNSIEMAARDLRHQFLTETARELKISNIVLAHHANDNIETFWLRILRGDVGNGLTGMRWARPATTDAQIRFIRPLLNISKSELREYAAQKSIPFREDSSNSDPTFLRNRLRIEILPKLEAFQPALQKITSRSIDVLAAEKAFLEEEAMRWLSNPARLFADLHIALQREIVRQQLLLLEVQPNFDLIEELRSAPNHPITFSPQGRVSRSGSGLLSRDEHGPLQFSGEQRSIDVRSAGRCTLGRVEFEWEPVEGRGPAAKGVEYFDADSLGQNVVIRGWGPADRFQPSGAATSAKLQDLLTNQKVPAKEKRRLLLGVSEDCKIFWVEGLRISECHKVTSRSRRVLKWTWRHRPQV